MWSWAQTPGSPQTVMASAFRAYLASAPPFAKSCLRPCMHLECLTSCDDFWTNFVQFWVGIMVYMNKLSVWITINLYNPHCHATTHYAQEVHRLHRGCLGCIGRALWVHPGGALRLHQGLLRALDWYQFDDRSMLDWCLCAQCRRVVRSALGQ